MPTNIDTHPTLRSVGGPTAGATLLDTGTYTVLQTPLPTLPYAPVRTPPYTLAHTLLMHRHTRCLHFGAHAVLRAAVRALSYVHATPHCPTYIIRAYCPTYGMRSRASTYIRYSRCPSYISVYVSIRTVVHDVLCTSVTRCATYTGSRDLQVHTVLTYLRNRCTRGCMYRARPALRISHPCDVKSRDTRCLT